MMTGVARTEGVNALGVFVALLFWSVDQEAFGAVWTAVTGWRVERLEDGRTVYWEEF